MEAHGGTSDDASAEEEFLYLLTEGSDLLRAGKILEASRQFERALALSPGHEQALNLLGLSHFRLGRFDEASRIFTELIDHNPVEPSLRLNLAMVYLKTERLGEARRALEQVLDLNPDHPRAASYMALVLERLDELHGAAEWYERAGNPQRAAEVRARLPTPSADPITDEGDAFDDDHVAHTELGSAAVIAEAAEDVQASPVAPLPSASPPSASPPSASVGAEAAALTAASVERLNRPSPPPSQGEADAARGASLGYTFDEPAFQDGPESPEAPGDDDDETDIDPTAPLTLPGPAAEAAPAKPEPGPSPSLLPTAGGEAAIEAPSARGLHRRRLRELADAEPRAHDDGSAQMAAEGVVTLAIREILYLRTDRLVALTGELEVEPINRRYRGRRTDSLFGGNETPMSAAMGLGTALLDPEDTEVTALRLESEDLYLVERHLLAFTDGLVWENGRLPAEDGDDLDIVHLRGTGDVTLVTERPVLCLEVRSDRPITVHAGRLIGWNGQIVPFRGPFPGLPESARRPPIVRFEGSGLVLTT